MDVPTKESLIDEVLVFANAEIESSGHGIHIVRFDFTEAGEDAVSFMKQNGCSYEDLNTVLNICMSREYLKHSFMTNEKIGLNLTEDGQARAISVTLARHAPPAQENNGGVTIGTFNNHGAAQVGNHNTQNIENVFASIIRQIDESDATEGEKAEAKGRLKAFLEHPLTSATIGAGATAIAGLCGAG